MTLHRRILLGFLAVFSLLIVGIGVFVSLQLRASTPLLSLLPENRVIAYFHGMELNQIRAFAPTYPVLSALPNATGEFSLAVIKDGNGIDAWIFTPVSEQFSVEMKAEPWQGRSVYRSFPGEIPVAAKGESVKDGQEFSALSGMHAERWAWLTALPGDAELFGTRMQHVMIDLWGNNDVSMRTASAGELPETTVLQIPDAQNGGVCIGTFGYRLAEMLLQNSVSDPALQGDILGQELSELLGADVSLQYDVRPLLTRPVTACLSGETGLWMGELTQGRRVWDTLSARLHDDVRASAAQGTVERKLVDNDYEYAVVKPATGTIETMKRTESGWAITETFTGSGTGLVTARKANRFLVATSKAWLDAGLKALPSGPAAYGGSLDLQTFDRSRLPAAVQAIAPLLSGNAVSWTLAGQNGVMNLRIRAH